MIEFYEIEPFGSQIEDLRMGMVASTIANVNRNAAVKPEPFHPMDFAPWARAADAVDDTPIELDDEKSQSDLIRAAVFGIPPVK